MFLKIMSLSWDIACYFDTVRRRTLAIFLRAELGFLGVAVLTAVQTPLFCGAEASVAFFLKELYPF